MVVTAVIAGSVWLAITIAAGPTTGLADASSQPSSAESGAYTRSVVASFDYGSEASQLGRKISTDNRPTGPASFAVDSSGRLAIADDVNGRIQVFSPTGGLLQSIEAKDWIHDIALDEAGDLYTLTLDGGVDVHDVETGQLKWRGAVVSSLAKSLGTFGVAGGSVDLTSPEQYSYPILKAGTALSASEQVSKSRGAKARTGAYYSTSYRNGGHVYQLDAKGKVTRDIALGLADVASVVLIGEDGAGNVYVQVERFTAKGTVGVEVRRFDSRGSLTATLTLAPITYLEMTRSTVVTEDGSVYQLLPTESGITLLRWQK